MGKPLLNRRGVGDYTQMTWVEAYECASQTGIGTVMPLASGKVSNWEELNAVTRPKVVQAMENDDEAAFATAILEYTKISTGRSCFTLEARTLSPCAWRILMGATDSVSWALMTAG